MNRYKHTICKANGLIDRKWGGSKIFSLLMGSEVKNTIEALAYSYILIFDSTKDNFTTISCGDSELPYGIK